MDARVSNMSGQALRQISRISAFSDSTNSGAAQTDGAIWYCGNQTLVRFLWGIPYANWGLLLIVPVPQKAEGEVAGPHGSKHAL